MTDKTNEIDKTIKTDKTKKKRLSKGQRTHIRRMKQEAGKTGPIPSSQKVSHTPTPVPNAPAAKVPVGE
jgi:hypothetical protein